MANRNLSVAPPKSPCSNKMRPRFSYVAGSCGSRAMAIRYWFFPRSYRLRSRKISPTRDECAKPGRRSPCLPGYLRDGALPRQRTAHRWKRARVPWPSYRKAARLTSTAGCPPARTPLMASSNQPVLVRASPYLIIANFPVRFALMARSNRAAPRQSGTGRQGERRGRSMLAPLSSASRILRAGQAACRVALHSLAW